MKRMLALAALMLALTLPVRADRVLYVDAQGDTTMIATLTLAQTTALNADLVSIPNWIGAALAGKVANCRERLVGRWLPVLSSDPGVESIPANADSLVLFISRRPGYQTRAQADSVAQAQGQ